MAAITREDMEARIRRLIRQVNTQIITDEDVWDAIDDTVDDLCGKAPFLMATDAIDGVKNQVEFPLGLDILEVIQVFYEDAAGATLKTPLPGPGIQPTEVETNEDLSDFPASGTIVIGDERIDYTGVSPMKFTGITRGADDTEIVAHIANTVIVEADGKFIELDTTSPRTLGANDDSYLSVSAGIPTSFYATDGLLGFDVPLSKNGIENILVRCYIRPPQVDRSTEAATLPVVQGLPELLHKAIRVGSASVLATQLASDDTAKLQSAEWKQVFNSQVAAYMARKHQFVRGASGRIVPYTGRR